MRCYFGRLGNCSGISQRAHWIPKARLKANGVPENAIWDRRVWTLMCEKHHHAFDKGIQPRDDPHALRMRVEDYPGELLAFAAEYDFEWLGIREGWRHVKRPSRQ